MITTAILGIILVSVACSAVAQIALKSGMSTAAVQGALAAGEAWPIALAIATSPLVWAGLALYGGGAVVWLFVLARVDVSVAYTFVALGFLLTMLLGWALLGEPITARKLAGTLLVMGGIWLVAGGR